MLRITKHSISLIIAVILPLCLANISFSGCGIGTSNTPSWYSDATIKVDNETVNSASVTIDTLDSELVYADVTLVFISYTYQCAWGQAPSPNGTGVAQSCTTCPASTTNRLSVAIGVNNAPILIYKNEGEEFLDTSCSLGATAASADLARGWKMIELGAGKPKNLSITLSSLVAGYNITEYHLAILQHGPAGPPSP